MFGADVVQQVQVQVECDSCSAMLAHAQSLMFVFVCFDLEMRKGKQVQNI